MSPGANPPWVAQVLSFWFHEVGEERWFDATGELDDRIRSRFIRLHEHLVAGEGANLEGSQSLLAAIIVLDQFSRNMFRGTPRTFAADALARRLAERVIDLGLDAAMTRAERYFVYLPYEHSEDREHQALAVRMIKQLGDESWTRYARAHQVLIERFGRFPHRNAILGRTSNAEELQYLQQSPDAF
jgi:uncharacterized protein (DUF924 family)